MRVRVPAHHVSIGCYRHMSPLTHPRDIPMFMRLVQVMLGGNAAGAKPGRPKLGRSAGGGAAQSCLHDLQLLFGFDPFAGRIGFFDDAGPCKASGPVGA